MCVLNRKSVQKSIEYKKQWGAMTINLKAKKIFSDSLHLSLNCRITQNKNTAILGEKESPKKRDFKMKKSSFQGPKINKDCIS